MKTALCFDDVLITPGFSNVNSRKDVDLSTTFCGIDLKLPVISSNMDTVTGVEMAVAMDAAGGISCLHRFESIEQNVTSFKFASGNAMFYPPKNPPIVSVGLGEQEFLRAKALLDAGAKVFCIDVAHGASSIVVEQVKRLRKELGYGFQLIVGNFANRSSLVSFLGVLNDKEAVQAVKVGIGGGSACLTRVVTGCGLPTLASVLDCSDVGIPIIADGGIKTSGDIAKALAAGASVVMLGGMLAGTTESPGEIIDGNGHKANPSSIEKFGNDFFFKKYRGSASTESYQVQGKVAQHRSHEGDAYLVKYKGPVAGVLQQIEGGLRSALSYVGATNLREFSEFAQLVQVTSSGAKENGSHGKK